MTFDIATATECPKCGLQAKTLLHRFCQHQECPVRDALKALKDTAERSALPRDETQ